MRSIVQFQFYVLTTSNFNEFFSKFYRLLPLLDCWHSLTFQLKIKFRHLQTLKRKPNITARFISKNIYNLIYYLFTHMIYV